MTSRSDRAAEWIYRGIWAKLVQWFRVPDQPPSLPTPRGEHLQQFHPARGFLKYLKFWFWFGLTIIDGAIVIGWLILTIVWPLIGVILFVPMLIIAIVPDIVVYIALHLRYDTTWYVLSSRSLRIRRGIWVIREMTITFENVQNIKVTQGPLMRFYGIKQLVVETAGSAGGEQHQHQAENQGLLEGVANADQLRDLILSRVRESRSAGLGDERDDRPRLPIAAERMPSSWRPAHLALLREIRNEARELATVTGR